MKSVEDLFSYDTSQVEIKNFFKEIRDNYRWPDTRSLPKEYYPYCYKLYSYNKHKDRLYKEDEIKTWFCCKNAGNYAIKFYTIYGKVEDLSETKAINDWMKSKKEELDYEKNVVIRVLRNIASIDVKAKKEKIVCPVKDEISGEWIYNKEDIAIDHYDKDFVEVAFDWLDKIKTAQERYYKKNIDVVHYCYKMVDKENYLFKDRDWNNSFYVFLKKNTKLRITTKNNNNKRTKKRMNWDLLKINACYIKNE